MADAIVLSKWEREWVPEMLTTDEVLLLRDTQASLREWVMAHQEGLVLADAAQDVWLLLENTLDPTWVDFSRKDDDERERARKQRRQRKKIRQLLTLVK